MAVVYSPHSGQVISMHCYCNINPTRWDDCQDSQYGCGCGCGSGLGCDASQNRVCAYCALSGWSDPMDITAAAGAYIICYTDCSTCASMRITQFDAQCPGGADPDPYGHSMIVDLYDQINGGGNHLGSVLYHHVANRNPNGILNATNPCRSSPYWGALLGTVPGGSYSGCYSGAHTHIQFQGGSVRSFSCNQSITGGGGGAVIRGF